MRRLFFHALATDKGPAEPAGPPIIIPSTMVPGYSEKKSEIRQQTPLFAHVFPLYLSNALICITFFILFPKMKNKGKDKLKEGNIFDFGDFNIRECARQHFPLTCSHQFLHRTTCPYYTVIPQEYNRILSHLML